MTEENYAQVGPQQVDAVLAFLPMFEAPDFSPGAWNTKEGFFPHYAYKPEVINFLRAVYEKNLVLHFDWSNWVEEARLFQENPSALATADLETILKLLTTHVRADRFNEGHLAGLIENGHLRDILRRLAELRSTMAIG